MIAIVKIMAMCLVLMLFTDTNVDKVTIYLIGDSTMSTKAVSAYPETGWGMPFSIMFDSTVTVENHAMNGRSTRTFISENRWSVIYDKLKPGDYVFIQFGHNDESKEKTDRYTSPDDYKKNLTKFITESQLKKAKPILITPVSRRKFTDGKIQDTHAEYSPLVLQVGRNENVPVIDLDKLSRDLLQVFGEEKSRLLFLQLQPGEHPNYPAGKDDNTHFNELGARKIAQIVLQQIRAIDPELAKRIVRPVTKK